MSLKGSKFDAAGFCGLPLVRRVYKALVVGLAVFIGMLVALREPFRGYLAEVQISGPATPGVDVGEGAKWLKQVDPHTAVVASPAGETSPRGQIRMTYVARQAPLAKARLDELAARWLCQYLPERLLAHRRTALADLRTAVAAAREREDAARQKLDELRQRQLVAMLRPGVEESSRLKVQSSKLPEAESPAEGRNLGGPARSAATTTSASAHERWEALRLALSQLLARCTEDHPEVISLRKQIKGMEGEPGISSDELPEGKSGPELIPAPAEKHAAESVNSPAGHFVSTAGGTVGRPATTGAPGNALRRSDGLENEADELEKAAEALTSASRERQEAEQRMSERMQELSAGPTATDWTAAPARVVLRLGGTPRSATLALGGVVAAIAAILMFRAAASAVLPLKILTPGELASLMEVPVVGNTSMSRATEPGDGVFRFASHTLRSRTGGTPILRLGTRGQVVFVTHAAELVIAIAAGACLLSIAAEPALATQVLADPFGTLSEVVGRYLG